MNAVYFSSVVLHPAVVVDMVRHRKFVLAFQTDLTDRYFDQNAITLWHISILHVLKPKTLAQSLEQELTHRHMRKRLTAVFPGPRLGLHVAYRDSNFHNFGTNSIVNFFSLPMPLL